MAHAEAVDAVLKGDEHRRGTLEGKDPQDVTWADISAIGGANVTDALELWARVRDAADDALSSGRRAAEAAGHVGPYERAAFLAIRDAFADEWKPQGGIESAMIDQLTIAFSLQMYWAAIAHERATQTHDEQRKAAEAYETSGWRSPFQSRADAIEQAHRLADGYNRQFLRVLRALRDLRRYSTPAPTPSVFVNQGGQINVASQQVNVKQ
jgi:hypothetical protein